MRVPVVIIFCCALFIGKAQSETTWKQIEQPYFRLVFNSDIGTEATRIADLLNHYFMAHLKDFPLKRPLRPIDIVLQTHSQISNGFVGLTPYRSVWFNRPGSFTGLEWFDALAVHESRHVVQFNQIYDTVLGRALGFALGDTGSGLMAFLLLPSWFIEGDAVLSETLLTEGGRGRIAAFNLWFRTDTVSNPAYSYDRAILGTDFERIPYLSPYVLGYYLSGHMQSQQGVDLFDRALNQIATAKGLTFNGRIRSETGLDLASHYQNLMTELKAGWSQEYQELKTTVVNKVVNQTVKHWNSFYPVMVEDGRIVAVEVDAIEGYFLVEVSQGQVRRLISLPRSVARNYYSASKTKSVFEAEQQFCWIDVVPHKYKILNESGDLFCWSKSQGFDRKTFQKNLTSGVYSDHEFMVHQFNPDQSSLLQLLDSDGIKTSEFQLPKSALAIDLISTGDGWLYVLTGSDSDGIYYIDKGLTQSRLMKPNQGRSLRSPSITGDWLIFTSDQSGIDQIVGRSISTGEEIQLVTRPFGSYFPIWNNASQSIVFSDYSPNGQQLSSLDLDLDSLTPAISDQNEVSSINALAYPSLLPETTPTQPSQQDYDIGNYSRLANLWHPYSWRLYADAKNVTGFLSSSDPLETLNLNFMVNYQPESQVWDGSVLAHYQTDLGPYVVLFGQHTFDNYWGNPIEVSGQVVQPIRLKYGAMSYQWAPGLGASMKHHFGQYTDPFILASIALEATKDKPLQAIHYPLHLEQSVTAMIPTGNDRLKMVSHTAIDIRGLTPRQNINVQINAQEKAGLDAPLLPTDSLFSLPDAGGLTVQTQMNYQMNLGPVGLPLSSMLFWRNTEISANLRMQQSPEKNESAIGLSVQPNMNVFRNDRLFIEPVMSVFYHVQNQTVTTTLSVVLDGN